MDNMRLTEEQKKIVEENHKLIYWITTMYKLDIEEFYDLLAIELCYTVMKYEPDKGSLANYYKLRAEGVISKEFRKAKAKKRIPKGTEFIDNVHSVGNTDDMLDSIELYDWIDSCDDSDILRLKHQGLSQMEVADKLGVSQSYVSKVLKKSRKCYNEINR